MTKYSTSSPSRRGFECDFCSSTFDSKSDLTTHSIHCEERPSDAYFQCEYCQNRYVSKHGLIDHLKSCETKQRKQSTQNKEAQQYQCDHCGKEFDLAHRLTRHKHSCSQSDTSTEINQSTDEGSDNSLTGYVSYYNSEEGYGFISTSDIEDSENSDTDGLIDVFFHVSSYPDESPKEKDRVQFEVLKTDDGFKTDEIVYAESESPEGHKIKFASDRKQWGINNKD